MALTLAEANKLSSDVLLTGVIETVIKESPILGLLPFIDLVGTGIRYNRERALTAMAYHAVGDTWTEDTPQFDTITETTRILGGDADVDQYLAKSRSNEQDLTASVLTLRAKALAYTYEQSFIAGDSASNANEFNGLQTLVPASQTIDAGGALTLAALDELLDKVRGGPPDALISSRRTRRKLMALARASGSSGVTEQEVSALGRLVRFYEDVPWFVSDFITDTEGAGSESSVYAIRFGEDGLAGLQSGPITIEPIGALETKDAQRHRIKWYASLALFNELAVARLEGITAA